MENLQCIETLREVLQEEETAQKTNQHNSPKQETLCETLWDLCGIEQNAKYLCEKGALDVLHLILNNEQHPPRIHELALGALANLVSSLHGSHDDLIKGVHSEEWIQVILLNHFLCDDAPVLREVLRFLCYATAYPAWIEILGTAAVDGAATGTSSTSTTTTTTTTTTTSSTGSGSSSTDVPPTAAQPDITSVRLVGHLVEVVTLTLEDNLLRNGLNVLLNVLYHNTEARKWVGEETKFVEHLPTLWKQCDLEEDQDTLLEICELFSEHVEAKKLLAKAEEEAAGGGSWE